MYCLFLVKLTSILYLAANFNAEPLPFLEAPHVSTCNQILPTCVMIRQEEYTGTLFSSSHVLQHGRLLHQSSLIITPGYNIN